jgi:photosystem II stability/assembly factor-like uncharacterized protein
VFALAIDPGNSQIIYAGTRGGGVYRSNDGGASWSATNAGIKSGYAWSDVMDPNDSQTAYAGTYGNGVLKTVNGGGSWSSVSNGLSSLDIPVLAIDNNNSQNLFAVSNGAVFKTADGGASWSVLNLGRPNTSINALAIDPVDGQTLYAGDGGYGVFKSTDGGVSWNTINDGLTPELSVMYVYALAIDPGNRQTVYAGVFHGLFKSIDGGTSWASASSGLPSADVGSVIVDPHDSQIIYAAVRGVGVFKSINGGSSWSSISIGLPSFADLYKLVIDPTSSHVIYATSFNGGVFRSTDGGVLWKPYNAGMAVTGVYSLAIDPKNSANMFAGTRGGGVFRSVTYSISGKVTKGGTALAGVTFSGTSCTTTDTNGAYSCSVEPRWSGSITPIFAGNTFSPASRSYSGVVADQAGQDYLVTPTECTLTIAKTSGQGTIGISPSPLLYSENSGYYLYSYATGTSVSLSPVANEGYRFVNWTGCDSLSVNDTVCTVAMTGSKQVNANFIPTAGACGSASGTTLLSIPTENLCLAGTASSVTGSGPWNWSCSVAGGATASCSAAIQDSSLSQISWQQLFEANGKNISAIAIDWNNSRIIFAGVYGSGVYKSDDGGNTWSAVNNGLSEMSITSLTIDPGNSQVVYAGTGYGAYKTTNGGASWSSVSIGLNPNTPYIAVDPSNSQIIYAATNGGGVYKSLNGGTSWVTVNTGLTDQFMHFTSQVIDPTNSQTVFAGAYNGGVFKTTNGGSTWSEINNGLSATNLSVNRLVIDPGNSQIIYAGLYGKGVYKSVDGGTSWSEVNSGLSGSIYVTSLAIDPFNHQNIYLGTLFNGAYKSANGGASWINISNGLTALHTVYSLAIDPKNSAIIYAATLSAAGTNTGIYKTVTYTISGRVTLNGSALAGVTFSGASCTTTDSSGAYSCTVAYGWSGTIIPVNPGSAFAPVSRSYSGVVADQTSQDFTASPVINGDCGSSNNATLSIAPAASLCATGTASSVTGSGPWSWSCFGTNGGSTVSCSATPLRSGIINPAPGKTAPDVSDALAVLKHISGGSQLTPAQATSADVAPLDSNGKPQGNGVLDTYDVIGILRMAVGLM